ncbi:GIY-YIG nuclease family protein [Gorillibacterium timonense]|uniref:GIY-YIG nuclease family protein n=1 Tax=Gorillibacterium timonense TaxID=1689269 RepID=UPI00071DF97E|nr:GIY-YIG nuclease family protein [Gorillibacterium timonense]
MAFHYQPRDYPTAPGCYLMKDASGTIIYVGKAKHLRNRLSSYFRGTPKLERTRDLVAEVASIEVVLVHNEAESLFLENNLIKLHRPKYNRALKKDNSGYAYLKVTKERIPRLDLHFRVRRDLPGKLAAAGSGPGSGLNGSRMFGPYPNGKFRNALLEFVNEHYGLRSCQRMPKRVCLYYHLGKCCGICEGMVTREEYMERIAQAEQLLANKENELIAELKRMMLEHAERLEFERAEGLRRQIASLEKLLVKQVVDRDSSIDQDVLYFGEKHVMIISLKEGMIRGMFFEPLQIGGEQSAAERFLTDRYREQGPQELILSEARDLPKLKQALRTRGAEPVTLTVPRRGDKLRLLELCRQNYEFRAAAAAAAATGEAADNGEL